MGIANFVPAPGARAVIRDAQWIIRKAEPTDNGGYLLTCTGLSEVVRDKEALFLTNIEKSIEILDPVKTKLLRDSSPSFIDSRLYIESVLRKSVPTDGNIYCAHKAAMDIVRYQMDPALKARMRTKIWT